MARIRPWLLALLAGALAAGADVGTHTAHVSHLATSALALFLFFAVGYRGRDLRAAAGGALLHALLNGLWIVHGRGARAGLPYATVAAAFALALDLLAAYVGARRAARML